MLHRNTRILIYIGFIWGQTLCASDPYFKTGLGVTASLGPGATVLNKNAGAFTSGNLRTTNGALVPGPAVGAQSTSATGNYGEFSGSFGVPWLNGNIERQNLGAVPIPIRPNPSAIVGGAFSGMIDQQSTGWKNGYPICYNGTGTLDVSYDNGDVAQFMCRMTGYVESPTSAEHLQNFFLSTHSGVTNALNSYYVVLGNKDNFPFDVSRPPNNPVPTDPDVLSGVVSAEDIVWTPNGPATFNNLVGTVRLNPDGENALLQAGASAPATPSTQIIDFSQGQNVKNKTGLSYLFGLVGQYIAKNGMSVALGVNYGRTGSSSRIDYSSGSFSGNTFQNADPITFSLKDSGYVSELLQLGYVYRRINPYFIFGLAQHKTRFSCPDAYNNQNNSISKGYNTPVFGIGMNIAVMKNLYVNLQWQRHMGGVKSWKNIEQVLPQDRVALGSPQTRFGSSMILVGVTYMMNFQGKR